MSLLDPEVIAKVEGLRLLPRLAQFSSQSGSRLAARLKGTSLEFVDYRPYVFGDEIKRIDWKVYARKDRYFLRSYEGETNCTLWIALDVSKSMDFKSDTVSISKWNFAAKLAIGLAFVALKNRDACGLALFGENVSALEFPKANWEVFSRIVDRLNHVASFSEATNYALSLRSFVERVPKRSMVVIISDFLGDKPDDIVSALEAVASLRHEVIAIRVVDPMEVDLKNVSTLAAAARFCSVEKESPAQASLVIEEVAELYRQRFAQEEEDFKYRLVHRGMEYWSLTSDQDPGVALAGVLQRRELSR